MTILKTIVMTVNVSAVSPRTTAARSTADTAALININFFKNTGQQNNICTAADAKAEEQKKKRGKADKAKAKKKLKVQQAQYFFFGS